MATDIIVPQMGESVLEGTIVEWKVKEGERVEKDQPLVELATDKINIEIPAEVSGIIGKFFAQPGETVRVGARVAVVLAEGEKYDAAASGSSVSTGAAVASAPAASSPTPSASAPIGFGSPAVAAAQAVTAVASSAGTAQSSNGRSATGPKGGGKMAPAVRKLIREFGADPKEITPTGPKGRLTKEDVMDFVDARSKVPAAPAGASAPSAPSASAAPTVLSAPTQAIPAVSFVPLAPGERERREPLSGPRKAIAEHMVRSKATSAHVTTFEECDLTPLYDFRTKNKEEIKQRFGVNITYMPFIMKACTVALKEFPPVNASMTDSEIIYKYYYNIGVAVGRDAGLIVPVVHDADKKSVLQLGAEIAKLSANANSNKLNPQNLMDGTFTITNAGMFGATGSTPIISQPQVCILGVHNLRKMPWVVSGENGDEIQIRRIINFGLSFDHRLVDGHIAVQFLHRVCSLLTDPSHLLVYA